MAPQRVLFVCAQNVCRSPYLAKSLAIRVADEGPVALSTSSRGTQVAGSRPMCAVASDRLQKLDGATAQSSAHLSRPLSARDIDGAGLILTAGVAERSAVALLDPAARARTFTVREAIWLGERDITGWERDRVGDESGLRGYAAVLNARRGTLELPEPAPTGRFRRSRPKAPEQVLDIPDRHIEGSASHQRLFGELDRYVETLAVDLARGLKAA